MNRIKTAWNALLGKDITQKAADPFPPAEVRFVDGKPTIISSPDNKAGYIRHGYVANAMVYAIISAITDKARIAPWGVYKIRDDIALKQYKTLLSKSEFLPGDFRKAIGLRSKALEPYDGDSWLTKLIERPNDEQHSMSDLVADSAILRLTTGDRYIYGQPLNRGADQGKPGTLEIMPSDLVTIVVDRTKWPMKVHSYMMTTFGVTDIPKEAVMHDKIFNPESDLIGMHFYGLSPLKVARMLVDRNNAEITASIASFQNLGPKYIAFTDDARLHPTDAADHVEGVKSKLTSKEYRGAKAANKFAVSAYKMGAVPIGMSPVDLNITESEWSTIRQICGVFKFPSALLNDPHAKTYNNEIEAQKALTTRCALPELNAFRNAFNDKLKTDWGYKNKNVFVDYDINVFSELQEDLGKKWTWVGQLPTTNRRKLELMGEDVRPGHDDFMDKIVVPSGFTTSEDYEQTEVDAALEAGDEGISEDEEGANL